MTKKQMTKKRLAGVAAVILGLVAAAAPVLAQQYPTRTVTVIVPYPAGGPTDETARVVAQSMAARLKQSFIVENISGGNTIVACEKVAHATPDGYTLILPNLQISANVTLFKTLPFDTVKDFTPVMLINRNPLVLVGRNTLPAANLKELIALMKKQRLKAAIPGYGATGHLATALFAQEAGAPLDMIPYRGAAPAITDLLGGQVDLFFATPQSVVQLVNTGKLKAFGVTTKDSVPELPKVESFVTAMGPKLDFDYWQALFAPAETPRAVIKTLNEAAQAAVADPAILKNWAAQGIDTFPPDQRSPEAAERFLKSEIARWGDVIRANNIHLDQ
ncbi:MAG TPA: tripartite tricarboxylate transporter substrate-binding protein [Xanthobacteraceae bacterium]|nr:tripartite tricarboxylate transporter substrate-binding protein [Xanthobacteraceae bacterium]